MIAIWRRRIHGAAAGAKGTRMARDNERLVYSTDPRENRTCPRCGQPTAGCSCVPDAPADSTGIVAVLRMERKGRGGKTVTVVDRLPRNEPFVRELARRLKTACGTGGTFALDDAGARVEIQGDHRQRLRELLQREGMRVRG